MDFETLLRKSKRRAAEWQPPSPLLSLDPERLCYFGREKGFLWRYDEGGDV